MVRIRQSGHPVGGSGASVGSPTRAAIVEAADALFYERGLRSVSVDEIAERAGVTKRTLYYHFDSKDELIAAYLAARDLPTMQRYRQWLGGSDQALPERVSAMFARLAAHARKPRWLGCGFTRAAVELASQPGHPAVVMAARHKQRFEAWLAEEFRSCGLADPAGVARQVMILLEGVIALALIHRDVAYARSAGDAAALIVRCAMADRGPGAGEGTDPLPQTADAMYTD